MAEKEFDSHRYIKKQYDKIQCSSEDKRLYRGLELVNDLKLLLISDTTTDKSAAALDVNTGHLHDPKDLPGLAHFCEHMLFLGTEKYPVENEYQMFLSAHGGSSNAFTDTDHTNYHFDVAPEYLEGAFDRFAQFFLRPLFTESCTEREVLAVDSEHTNNIKSDSWRYWQLQRTLCNPEHVFAKFGTGNKTTLLDEPKKRGVEPREHLLNFHQANYSSNRMSAVVLGKESLDQLERMVAPILSQIPNKNLAVSDWTEHPYGPDQVCRVRHMVPIKDLRSMNVSFPIPDENPWYKSNPAGYISHLIGHEGPGSLLSELKRRGWVNSLSAGPHTAARGFGFFSIDLTLSLDGLEHTDDILQLIFNYVAMLRTVGPQEWLHREVDQLNRIHFRFQDKIRPQSYVTNLAKNVHIYPLNEVLSATYFMPDYKPELIASLTNQLSAQNFVCTIKSQIFKGKTDLIEPWYGTEYSCFKADDDLMSKLRKAEQQTLSCFKMPEKNAFIPEKFDLYSLDSSGKGKLPEVIAESAHHRLWFKQDDEYLLPKCCVYLHIRNPLFYASPLNCALSTLFVDLFLDSITEFVYSAELAGLNASIFNGRYGLSLNLTGYNEKQGDYLRNLVQKMTEFSPKADRFEVLKERYLRNLRNFDMEQPYQHAIYYTSLIKTSRIWSNEQVLQVAQDMQLDQLKQFIPQLFDSFYVEAYIHGNSSREVARNVVGCVIETLKTRAGSVPLFESQLALDRSVDLPLGSYRHTKINKTHANSAMELIFQTGLEDPRENMMLELLGQILHEPFFDQLRTQQQLGYIVFSGVNRSNGSQGLRFIIQGAKAPEIVESRVEAFLDGMLTTISKMDAGAFEQHKESLATLRLEKPKRMSGLAGKFWGEITNRMNHFERDEKEVKLLRTLTQDDLIAFYQTKIARGAAERRKLSVHVKSQQIAQENGHGSLDKSPCLEFEEVTSVDDFKAHLPLCPLPRPYRQVTYSDDFTKS